MALKIKIESWFSLSFISTINKNIYNKISIFKFVLVYGVVYQMKVFFMKLKKVSK